MTDFKASLDNHAAEIKKTETTAVQMAARGNNQALKETYVPALNKVSAAASAGLVRDTGVAAARIAEENPNKFVKVQPLAASSMLFKKSEATSPQKIEKADDTNTASRRGPGG